MGFGRQRLDHINLPGLQRGEAHGRLLNELPDNALQPRRALMPGGGWRPVVIRVAHQFDLALPVPADDLERPAAHWAFAVFIAGTEQRGGRLYAQKTLGQDFQKRRVRGGQVHHRRMVIEHIGAAVLADITARRARLGFRVGHVIEVGLDRRRVERRAVGEVHVIAQMEGVRQAIGRDLPTFRQPGPDLALVIH